MNSNFYNNANPCSSSSLGFGATIDQLILTSLNNEVDSPLHSIINYGFQQIGDQRDSVWNQASSTTPQHQGERVSLPFPLTSNQKKAKTLSCFTFYYLTTSN